MKLHCTILAATLAISIAAPAFSCTKPAGAAAVDREMLAGVNAERARAGLPGLRQDPCLQAAAEFQACDMAAQDRLSHTSSNGAELRGRMQAQTYPYQTAAENIGKGQKSAASAVGYWMGSNGHRQNILMPVGQDFGGAVAVSAKGNLYWVMVVAESR